jgi:hypothetical protein
MSHCSHVSLLLLCLIVLPYSPMGQPPINTVPWVSLLQYLVSLVSAHCFSHVALSSMGQPPIVIILWSASVFCIVSPESLVTNKIITQHIRLTQYLRGISQHQRCGHAPLLLNPFWCRKSFMPHLTFWKSTTCSV